jgi:hypothetical protein
MDAFACLCPLEESQCLLWFLLDQSLDAFLAILIEVSQAVSGPVTGSSFLKK